MSKENLAPNDLLRLNNKNCYLAIKSDRTILYSYDTPVIVIVQNRVYRTSQFYSVTTSRHINNFLRSINCDNPELLDQEAINSFC